MWLFAKDDSCNLPGAAYQFSFKKLINGEPLPLSQFQGNVLLIVNTASHCGFTPQFKELEKLYTTYKNRGLMIIGVPCNDFGRQEPGTSEEIAKLCQDVYRVTFPLAHKEVISGRNAHSFYCWAKKALGFGAAPKWNFHKYLINRKGQLVDYFHTTTAPDAARVAKAVEKCLDESDK